jgi:O-antigen/teichoic acid export membrane protein
LRRLLDLGRGQTARNSALNLIGVAIPLLIGLALVPITVHGLGVARFGILSLGLAILEYSTFFALGLGPATTRHVAESLARGDDRAAELVTISMLSHTALGILGGLIVVAIAPLLAARVFVVPAPLVGEATAAFRLLGLMVPLTLLLLSQYGALDGASKFGLSNSLRIPFSILSFAIPAIAVTLGYGLLPILAFLVVSRALVCSIMLVAISRAFPRFRWELPRNWTLLKPLLSFGAWISVSNLVSPALVYGDRFFLGALKGVAAVGTYAAPFDALMRCLIVPHSVARALFPKMTGLYATGQRSQLRSVVVHATGVVAALIFVPLAILFAFAPFLIGKWLGPQFAEAAGTAARILAVGFFFNSLAPIPFGLLAAIDRPDINAKFHLAELCLHVPLTWWLVSTFGISGAATAWSIRSVLDAILLFSATSFVLRGGDGLDRTIPEKRDGVGLPVYLDAG